MNDFPKAMLEARKRFKHIIDTMILKIKEDNKYDYNLDDAMDQLDEMDIEDGDYDIIETYDKTEEELNLN